MKVTKAQSAVLDLLLHGFGVSGIRYNEFSGYFRAECEYLPHIKMSTLNALHNLALIEYEMDGPDEKIYSLTQKGRAYAEQGE